MKQIRWFDRKFDFAFDQNIFPSIIERLEGTPILLNHKIDLISQEHLTTKVDGKWSIQENIGHLIDVEPLWQERLEDILNEEEYMRPADLENKRTDSANHNEKEISQLLDEFVRLRQKTTTHLNRLNESDVYKYSMHPRLNSPMRIMDLFLFVAEHDDHHLARISEIDNQLSTQI